MLGSQCQSAPSLIIRIFLYIQNAANIRVIGLICQGMFASRIFCVFGSRSGGLVSTDDFKGGLNLVAQIAESDFVMPFLFICMEQLGSHWKNFHEILYL